ncbi:MAG: metal ABC transporter substrate-binding protein [candidate division WOR-3 bacterium]
MRTGDKGRRAGWAGAVLLALGLASAGPVRVVTTIPDLADWARNVGGNRVRVQSLLHGAENPHTYEPGPDDARAVAEADLLVRVGLGLEEWLDGLVTNARNRKQAVLTVAEELAPESFVAAHDEHEHQLGNPHVWLDPENAKAACSAIGRELGRIDSAGAAFYQARVEQYQRRLDSLTNTLKGLVQNLPDRRFIAHHDAWPYFARRFGFEVIGSIEPLPGEEPSAKHLAGLVKMIRAEKVRAICTEPQLPRDVPAALARETGASLVLLAPVTGSLPQTSTYLKLLDYNVRTLVRALGQ